MPSPHENRRRLRNSWRRVWVWAEFASQVHGKRLHSSSDPRQRKQTPLVKIQAFIQFRIIGTWTPTLFGTNIHFPYCVRFYKPLQTAQYFTVIDVHWGFNNVCIREGEEWKAAFITNWGLFKPLVMYFGMCNAPAMFQQMMDVLFQKVLMSGRVFVYVDDVLIAGDDLEELCHWTREVLMIMRESRLSCKPVKCQFEQQSVK
jgi:hypothetical protein